MSQINFEHPKSIIREHTPEVLTGIGVVGTVMSTMLVVSQYKNKAVYYKIMYEHTGSDIYLIKYLQMTKTNNWLKMHGYPMRRRRRH